MKIAVSAQLNPWKSRRPGAPLAQAPQVISLIRQARSPMLPPRPDADQPVRV